MVEGNPASSGRAVRFYFDFLSPYAFLAWQRVHDVVESRGGLVEPAPVLFAGLLNHWGQLGPAEIAPKRDYVFRDAYRNAAGLGIVLSSPKSHPFRPLLALRLCCLDLAEDLRKTLISGLFDQIWVRGGGVESAAEVAPVLEAAGLPASLLEATADPDIKARLRSNTEAAIAAGVFGVPTMTVDHELFWGFDSLPHLGRYLDGLDPLAKATEFRIPQASARR